MHVVFVVGFVLWCPSGLGNSNDSGDAVSFLPADGLLRIFLLHPRLWRLLLVAFLLLGFLSWPVPQHLANHPATCLGLIPPGLFTRRGSPAGRTPEPDQPIHGTHESVVVFVIGLMGIWSTPAETERKVRPDG